MATNLNDSLLQQIDKIEISEQAKKTRERYFNEPLYVRTERLTAFMKSWKETEGECLDLRRAKALYQILNDIPIAIQPGELTCGSPTDKLRGEYPPLDNNSLVFKQSLDEESEDEEGDAKVTFGSPETEGLVSKKDWKICREATEFLKGQTGPENARKNARDIVGSWYDDLLASKGSSPPLEDPGFVTGLPRIELVVTEGLGSVIKKAEKQIERMRNEEIPWDIDKMHFWQSCIIADKAVINYAHRYSELAAKEAKETSDPKRKKELEKIADVMSWVPENPARDFHEAIEDLRFMHLCFSMEGAKAGPSGMGRIDQYLYPYFKKDIESGAMTIEHAAELVEDVYAYFSRRDWILSLEHKTYGQFVQINNFTLAGVDENMNDVSNELTYLVLHVAGILKYAEPHISLRLYPNVTPKKIIDKSLWLNERLPGNPMFVNDRHVIQNLEKNYVPKEYAWDWCFVGCSALFARPQRGFITSYHFNAALTLDLALHNGVASVTGKKIGTETGDPRNYKTFDEMWRAWKTQHEYVCRRMLKLAPVLDKGLKDHWAAPLAASLYDNTIENGVSHINGGLGEGNYNNWLQIDRALVDVGDSLEAIKYLVFDQKKLTMGELIDALDSNFAGERGAEIQQMCLDAPKFGNDIDEVDYLVRDVGKWSAEIIESSTNEYGGHYAVSRNGISWHYSGGLGVGSLPNGRKYPEPLYDGAVSPGRGMDKNGPTAVLKSVLKADFTNAGVTILNQKFPLDFMQNPDNFEKVEELTCSFLDAGGTHVQYNFLDSAELREAQKKPEDYEDLVVRVAGYSAYFVGLTPQVQEDVILRTEQTI